MLSDAAAESLSKHEGKLYLKGLKSLKNGALAGKMASSGHGLELRRLKELSDAAAEAFSKYEGELF